MNRPPADRFPPVLLDSGDALVVDSPGPGRVNGAPFAIQSLKDFVLDAELGLTAGADEDRCGLYIRQGGAERYVGVTLNGRGDLSVGLVDGGPPLVVAGAPLPDDVPFNRGVGATNRLTIVACGPMAAVIVNGVAVTAAALDLRYVAGGTGAMVVQTSPGEPARAVVRWVQARALLADPG
jgi:hypothetical protein